MTVVIPEPGSGAFPAWVKRMSDLTGLDQTAVRLVAITMIQQSETNARLNREADERERRYGPDI